jgi:hypothetical protein
MIKLSQEVLEQLIMSLIGCLNGRRCFIKYLELKSNTIISNGGSKEDVIKMVKAEYHFWSSILNSELEKYDKMRTEERPIERGYAFVHFEFDDLFRYYKDPVSDFNINIYADLSEIQQNKLIETFHKAIEIKRQIPWSILPISFFGFLSKIYKVFFIQLINLTCYFLFGRCFLTKQRCKSLNWSLKEADREAAIAIIFWKIAILGGVMLNIIVWILFYRNITNTSLPVFNFIFLFLLQCFFIPIIFRSFIQLLRTGLAFYYSQKHKIAPIKTWQHVRKFFTFVFDNASSHQKGNFFLMLKELRENNYINNSEFERFKKGSLGQLPINEAACYRIRRWMNKFYHTKTLDLELVISWNELKTLTVLVFSLNEKFSYTFDELTSYGLNDNNLGVSIVEQLRKSYPDEWSNLIFDLRSWLSDEEAGILLNADLRNQIFPIEVVMQVEYWANTRIQNIYHTLESAKKVFAIYERLAREKFPDKDNDEILALVKGKVQIIFLHDSYPGYSLESEQKKNIDNYLGKNPDIELSWPKDLLHFSKYRSFASILPNIRGEFLLTLDADHHADIEEVAFLPYLFKIFDCYSACDALGFRLYAFNEKYNIITRLVSLSDNAWWVHDLRVKSLVGGGGVYGKMLIRTKALLEKEFIQPDSVAEDMLAMSRLVFYGSEIKFSDLMEIGQGEDISYYGLMSKLGRYPVGAVESTATKLYQEMFYSPDVPLYRKLESLFMLSFYPIQSIIALSHLTIMFAWALDIKIMSFFPFFAVLAGYAAITLIDGLYVWVHMYEREGIIRGTKRYITTLLPMMLFHGSYFYHYMQQLIKGLKGYARFNISEKKYNLSKRDWNYHYSANKFAFNMGSLGLGLFIWGVLFYTHNSRDYILMMPFIFNIFLWGFSMLAFVPRKEGIFGKVDIIGEAAFMIIRSYYDIFLWPFKFLKKKIG